ncbi:MAG: hypothetical protein CSA35_04580 [Dethiosulfovibrio peptidovorans]|nr:MAG: hypothetical protein CSA35_04580 [Dethiosulfovibrio peptidovorans]
MKKPILWAAVITVALGLIGGHPDSGQALALPWDKEHGAALRVFQLLNYLDFGLARAVETHDALLLAREYDVLAGELNLSAIQDEQVIQIIESLGDMVDRSEADRLWKQVQSVFTRKTHREIYEGLMRFDSPQAAALAVISRRGAPWYDYARNRETYRQDLRGKVDLTDGQIRKLTELRKDMLRISWELVSKYDSGIKVRLSGKEMDHFVTILTEHDPVRLSRRLRRLLEDQPAFAEFPPLWFYLGMAETQRPDRNTEGALYCFKRYEGTYKGIFIRDPLLVLSAMESIALLSEEEHTQTLRCLEVLEGNCTDDDWQCFLLSAIVQARLGLIPQARENLQRNMDNGHLVSLCARVLGTILLDAGDLRGLNETTERAVTDPRIRRGDILSLAAHCTSTTCINWLNKEVARMRLSLAKSDKSSVRLELPSDWIDVPCSMDVQVTWSPENQGWRTSLSATALAVLPQGDLPDLQLLETPPEEAPRLPKTLTVTLTHPLFRLVTDWELIPPDDSMLRSLKLSVAQALPFYRPEVGKYRIKKENKKSPNGVPLSMDQKD